MTTLIPGSLSAMLRCSIGIAALWAHPLNMAMQEFEIDTDQRMFPFLAQIGWESMRLSHVKEIWGPTAQQLKYERDFDAAWPPTSDDATNHIAWRLGNSEAGDGKKFMGRDPIQTTGRKNYKLCGDALRIDLIENPEMLEHQETGARAACWFWRVGAGLNLGSAAKAAGLEPGCDLNDLADANDFKRITLAINGSLETLPQRTELLNHIISVAGG
jgi:putative chitinase